MNKEEFIKKWLKDHQYCVIATSCKDDPWAATVNYSLDDDFNIYISTNPASLKFKNILENLNVCLVIDSQNREGTLQIKGVAEILKPTGPDEPNIKIKPSYMVFKSKGEAGELNTIELKF